MTSTTTTRDQSHSDAASRQITTLLSIFAPLSELAKAKSNLIALVKEHKERCAELAQSHARRPDYAYFGLDGRRFAATPFMLKYVQPYELNLEKTCALLQSKVEEAEDGAARLEEFIFRTILDLILMHNQF